MTHHFVGKHAPHPQLDEPTSAEPEIERFLGELEI